MRRLAPVLLVLVLPACAGNEEPTEPGATPAGETSRPREAAAQPADPAYEEARRRSVDSIRAGRIEEGLAAARQAVELAPAWADGYSTLSDLYTRLARDDDAAEVFSELASTHAEQPEAWFYKGVHESRRELWDEARVSLERCLALDGDHAGCQFRLAGVLHATGAFEESVQAHRRAYELDPASSRAVLLARALRIQADYASAETVIVAALETWPDSAELHHALARIRLRQRRPDEALSGLRRAVELDPTLFGAQQDLGAYLLRNGQEAEGRMRLTIAQRYRDYREISRGLVQQMREEPAVPRIPLMLAELDLSVGRNDSALRWLSLSQARGGDAERIGAARAWAYFSKGEMPLGETELRRLAGSETPHVELARAARLVKLGQFEEAAGHLDRAVTEGPNERSFLRRASDLYATFGAEEQARELLRRATTAGFP